MPVVDYIQINPASETGVWYSLRVQHGTWRERIEQPMSLQRTLSGAGSKSFGKAYRVWEFTALVKPSEDSGYASLAKIEELMGGATAARHQLLLRPMRYDATNSDHHEYPAHFASAFEMEVVGASVNGANTRTRFLVPITLQQYGDPAS